MILCYKLSDLKYKLKYLEHYKLIIKPFDGHCKKTTTLFTAVC